MGVSGAVALAVAASAWMVETRLGAPLYWPWVLTGLQVPGCAVSGLVQTGSFVRGNRGQSLSSGTTRSLHERGAGDRHAHGGLAKPRLSHRPLGSSGGHPLQAQWISRGSTAAQ